MASSLAAPLMACFGQDRTVPAGAPNFLFLVVDDLNDWVACLGGHPQAQTPHIDRLASEGTLFTRAYANSPLCMPSRTSALSGLLPSTTGAYRNGTNWRKALAGRVPVSETLSSVGYETLSAGKVFHGPWGRRHEWITRLPWSLARHSMQEQWGVWDDFLPWQDSPRPGEVPGHGIPELDPYFDWGALDIEDDEMGDMRVADWIGRRLEGRRERPFFLAAGIYRPHLPWFAPRRYFDLYPLSSLEVPATPGDDIEDLPPEARRWIGRLGRDSVLREKGRLRAAVQAYLANVSFADACVGRVLDGLRRSPHAENTVVILWSDHGFHLGEKRLWDKRVLWEEATRVPLIVSGAGMPRGQRSSRVVSLVDLVPTILELAGNHIPAGLDGRSLSPLLEEPDRSWPRPAVSTLGPDNHSVRTERWRYIRYADGGEELYDHTADPNEWTNLASSPQHREIREELAAHLPSAVAPDATRG